MWPCVLCGWLGVLYVGRTVVSVFLVYYRWVYVLNVAVCTVWVVGCTVCGAYCGECINGLL